MSILLAAGTREEVAPIPDIGQVPKFLSEKNRSSPWPRDTNARFPERAQVERRHGRGYPPPLSAEKTAAWVATEERVAPGIAKRLGQIE